ENIMLQGEKTKMEASKKHEEQYALKLMKEKEDNYKVIMELKQDLEREKKQYEQRCQRLEIEAKQNEARLQERIREVELLLSASTKRINELEAFSESKFQSWNHKENALHNFLSSQIQSVKSLRMSSEFIKVEVVNSQSQWREEISNMGARLKVLADAAENYHTVLAENRKLYNEVQELKGNIRVYCRIRPFLRGQNSRLTTIDYIGENGELALLNPSRQGKDGHRLFKFNKIFGPTATQAQVFLDIQPLIRSVLDGFNVCIFAYGQTGSGKTFTMSGPNLSSKEDWGVNYRALSDLFHMSQVRRNAFTYEVGVQMVEIYNEQVRDLLSNSGSQKRLGIWSISQPQGLVVPDASMFAVKSTSDVLELMQFGQTNRAVGSTALNERSSRSHSILTVHVRGVDLKTGSTSRGCLHLIDLAGSERVERSKATGDRLKEAQHINKSLSALGDVIFALSQKSAHVPYRNSKLTQVLQSSLGGQAKALMFVQVNPDLESFSETLSTLMFAERVSGVELGAAKSNKEGKDIKELIEQGWEGNNPRVILPGLGELRPHSSKLLGAHCW
ncbi:kinesin-like protein KIN-14K, partial [Phalaenopsis equestris]|uniref:kinesin-like protein KIN-14K n=1 Tax=Phalaenopsis equestris TaxID=78828 RepID=UPI0009E1B77A